MTVRSARMRWNSGQNARIAPALAEMAKQVEYFLGSRHRARLLKKEGYGKFTMLARRSRSAGTASLRN